MQLKKTAHLKKLLRIMRLTAILLTAFTLHVAATGNTQTVTLSLKSSSLAKAFAEIEKQTGYSFVYGKEQLANAQPVNINVKDEKLETVLTLLFKDQPLTYTITGKYISIKQRGDLSSAGGGVTQSVTEVEPPIDIHGRIVNEKNEPVAASIVVKGTNKGTTTNDNGEFELKGVDDNATLVISGVSIETFEVKVNGRSELTMNAKIKTTQGEEVIVEANTGYQRVKPNEVTGSLVVVDNKTLNQQTGTNILQRLNNVTSGLYFNIGKFNQNPQNTTNISIRGLSTINGPLDPLIVLDNFIYEGDINNINPNDVEAITVLKDAAATSIWGARAGNGVIVITTKKGKFNQKLKVDINSAVIVADKPDLFYLSQISPSDEINIEQWLFNQGYFNSQINNNLFRPALTPAVEIFLKRRSGQISSADSASKIDALKTVDSRDQYSKYFYQKAITQQYSLGLNGGSNNISWLITGSIDRSIGTLKNQFNKANVRFLNSYKISKKLQLDAGAYYTNSKSISGMKTGILINGRQVPYLAFIDQGGNQLPIYQYRSGYLDTVGGGKLLDWKYYPLDDYKHDVSTARLEEIVGNAGVTYQIFQNLKFTGNYQYERQNVTTDKKADLQSFFVRDLINNFTQISPNGTVNYVIPYGGILDEFISATRSQNARGQLNYANTRGDHSISSIIGSEFREVVATRKTFRYYGYNEDPLTYGSVDYINRYQMRVPRFLRTIPNPSGISGTSTYRFVSFYANASYKYKQRYSFYGSIRRDGSNVFGAKTNDKWKPLWSSGIGWELSKEKFYGVTWLPDLKLKATYGESGNVDLLKTPLPVSASGYRDVNTGYPSQSIGTPNNPSLRWEKSKQLNLGIEFAVIKQRLSGSVEYYNKKGSDLYGQTSYDYTSFGFYNTVVKNIGNMSSRGIDLILSSKNFDKQFKWATTLLYNHNTSKTTAYYTDESQKQATLITAGQQITPVIGYPLYAIAAYKWMGLNSAGDPQGVLDKQISNDYYSITNRVIDSGLNSGSMVYVGSATPTNFGSLTNDFNWKGVSFTINISYALGYYFRKQPFSSELLISNGLTTGDFIKRWQRPGDENKTNVAALVYNTYPQFSYRDGFYRYSEINVLKADHVRLQFISLAYTINNRSGKIPIESIQIYGNAANLGIIWRANKEHLDPDYPASIPQPKSYTIGLRVAL